MFLNIIREDWKLPLAWPHPCIFVFWYLAWEKRRSHLGGCPGNHTGPRLSSALSAPASTHCVWIHRYGGSGLLPWISIVISVCVLPFLFHFAHVYIFNKNKAKIDEKNRVCFYLQCMSVRTMLSMKFQLIIKQELQRPHKQSEFAIMLDIVTCKNGSISCVI